MNTTLTDPAVAHGTYTTDPDHSTVGFAIKHMIVSTFRGGFDRFSAVLVSDDEGVRIDGTVDVTSVSVANADLAAQLMSPQFFDAEKHPELRFAGSTLRRSGERVEIDGELTIRGITQPVTVTGTMTGPTEDAYGAQRIGLDLEAVVDRAAYGLEWNQPLPRGGFALGDDVKLQANLALVEEG